MEISLTLSPIFFIILISHFIGDFLFQTDNMTENKNKSNKWLTYHLIAYSFPIFIGANKKQMAEWLAENVLGWTYCKECATWVSPDVTGDIVKFINSPDGFLAVWDKCLSEDLQYEAFHNTVYEAMNEKSTFSGGLKMTKREALEEVRVTVSKFNDYLNETDPGHAINIIEPVNAGFTLSMLDDACRRVLSWVEEQAKKELERTIDRQTKVNF